MKKLHLDTIEYEYREDDEYTPEGGMTHRFASIKKITTYKGNKKYQSLTIKHEHLGKFIDFLKDIVGGEAQGEGEQDVPF